MKKYYALLNATRYKECQDIVRNIVRDQDKTWTSSKKRPERVKDVEQAIFDLYKKKGGLIQECKSEAELETTKKVIGITEGKDPVKPKVEVEAKPKKKKKK